MTETHSHKIEVSLKPKMQTHIIT